MYDLVIKGGRIIDGSRMPGFGGDVAIKGDRIAAVGTTHVNDLPRTAQYSLECLLYATGSHDSIKISNNRAPGGVDVSRLRRLRHTSPRNGDQKR